MKQPLQRRSVGLLLVVLAVAGSHLYRQRVIVNAQAVAQRDLAESAVEKRAFYGRRLEPKAVILHGAGQSDEASFAAYAQAVAPAAPMLMMRYIDLRGNLPAFFTQLHTDLGAHAAYLIPQIGLSMNADSASKHYEASVAAGDDDASIAALCAGLQSLNRPVFLRIGYEFNGPWNGYQPASYVAAYQRVARALRTCAPQRVALVWDWTPEGNAKQDWAKYYPGDQYVDWWGFNPFRAENFSSATTQAFLAEASARRFPVMVAESSPRGHPVTEGVRSAENWFAPYFGLMRRSPGIKAFCYIDWDWRAYPQWADWGDGRIEDNAAVLSYYRSQVIGNQLFAGAANRDATLKLLRLSAEKTRSSP